MSQTEKASHICMKGITRIRGNDAVRAQPWAEGPRPGKRETAQPGQCGMCTCQPQSGGLEREKKRRSRRMSKVRGRERRHEALGQREVRRRLLGNSTERHWHCVGPIWGERGELARRLALRLPRHFESATLPGPPEMMIVKTSNRQASTAALIPSLKSTHFTLC